MLAHGPVERVKLMGQRNHAGLDRCQQQVVFHRVQQLRSRSRVKNAVC